MFKDAVARSIAPEETPIKQVVVKQPKVWDLPVRATHWLLVIAVIGAFVTNKLGVSYFRYHVWCGYTVIVLVTFRLIWGLIGSHHARFHNFIRGPGTVVRYLRDEVRGGHQPYAGHNPLGALMVVVLLLGLLAQAVSGLYGNDEIFNVGPLYGYVSNDLSLKLTSFHRKLFYWLLAAIAIHILAVITHWLFKKENLISAMFTGHKPHVVLLPHETARVRNWLAFAVVAMLMLLLWSVITHAPTAVGDAFSSLME